MIALPQNPHIARILARIRQDGILFSPEEMLEVVQRPHWNRDGAAHDWRRHVPPAVRDQWNDLTLFTRLCVFETAERAAMDEAIGATMVTGPRA